MFTFHNSRGSSNIDFTIVNNNLTAAVNEWEISAEETCSDHDFLKYKIGITNSCNNVYNYQVIRYIVKEDKYHKFDRKFVQETLKIFENVNYEGSVEEVDVNLSTIALKENDLEKFIDTFTEALQSACRKTFKTISTENQTKKKKSVPWQTEGLTIMQKRINALRRIYQRTRNNEEFRESRKRKYFEEKKNIKLKLEKRNSTSGRGTAM
jgi:paraquat-inducible protein B